MNHPSLKSIGHRVRYWRKYHHPSLPAAAKFAKLPKSTWSKVENGKTDFSYKTICKVADALFMRVGELL